MAEWCLQYWLRSKINAAEDSQRIFYEDNRTQAETSPLSHGRPTGTGISQCKAGEELSQNPNTARSRLYTDSMCPDEALGGVPHNENFAESVDQQITQQA